MWKCVMKGVNGITNIQKDGERKWSKNDPPIYQRRFKVGGKKRMFLKMSVLLVPCSCTEKTFSTESITSSSRAVFLVHAKERNLKSLPVSHLSIFFPLHLKAAIEGKKAFPISASEDTSETWAWVHCSVEQGISCCRWGLKSILQAELLTTHRPKNPRVHKSEEGMERREEMSGERKWRLKEKRGIDGVRMVS